MACRTTGPGRAMRLLSGPGQGWRGVKALIKTTCLRAFSLLVSQASGEAKGLGTLRERRMQPGMVSEFYTREGNSFVGIGHDCFKKKKKIICVCMCTHWRTCLASEAQKRGSNLLELELQTVIIHLMWVLGTKLYFSEGAASDLNC